MGAAIANCHVQIHETLALPEWDPQQLRPFTRVLYLGMGGSAIGGDMVRLWSERLCQLPMTVSRDYRIPGWVDGQTLVLVASYSGNTEETLSAAAMAGERGAQLVALTSGGELAQLAQTNSWPVHEIPSGYQPRAAIGYSLAAICRVLVAAGMLPRQLLDDLEDAATLMGTESVRHADPASGHNRPLEVARLLAGKLPIIYGVSGSTEGLAVRFRGQLAENSNVLAVHHLLPEMNHNEIVGLADRLASDPGAVVIWLTDEGDHERIALRQKLTAELCGIRGSDREIILSGTGPTLVHRNLTLLNLTDWISYYLALERRIDPTAIEILLQLKSRLANGE